MNPVHKLTSARERLSISLNLLAGNNGFYFDRFSNRDNRAHLLRRFRRDFRAVNHALTECATLAFSFMDSLFPSG